MFTAAPRPAITPQPSRPTTAGSALGSTFVHWPACDEGLVGERADAQRRGQLRAVVQGHLLAGVVGVEAVPRAAAPAGPAVAAHRSPVQHDEVADGSTWVTPSPTDFDDAGRLVAEQERELVVDATVAVGQVGVADPARLDPHDHFAGPGSGTVMSTSSTGAPLLRAMTPRTCCGMKDLSELYEIWVVAKIDVLKRPSGLQRQAQPVCVEHCRVNVAAGHRVSDAEQLIAAIRISLHLLLTQVEQRLLVYLTEIG